MTFSEKCLCMQIIHLTPIPDQNGAILGLFFEYNAAMQKITITR